MLNALSVISLAAIVAAGAESPASPARPTNALPPIGITVVAGHGVEPALVARILAETDLIWRGSGFSFIWQRDGGLPSALRVTIDDEPTVQLDGQTTLGWIHFDGRAVPEPEIHLSYANAVQLLEQSAGVVGDASHMPRAQREILLSRAMGRALAHEMGHYLLASKAHTAKGLMATKRSATDLFSAERTHFQIDDSQRLAMAARFAPPATTAGNRSVRAAKQD
jgi:hypothetical protein